MNIFGLITMIIVPLIVWGGLALFLSKAIKYEKLKEKDGKG